MVPQSKVTPKSASSSKAVEPMDSMAKSGDRKVYIRVPRRQVNRDDVYRKKMVALSRMYADVEKENEKYRYHIYCIREEIERLTLIKRGLCQRLTEHGDKDFMDSNIEYLDTSWQDERFEQIFKDVLAGTTNEVIPSPVAQRVVKKPKSAEKKKPKEQPSPPEKPGARETIQRILHAASSEIQMREKSDEAANSTSHQRIDA